MRIPGRRALTEALPRVAEALPRDLALMLLAFAVLRAFALIGPGPFAHPPDTNSYFRLDFFGGEIRLWTVPLFYELLPSDVLRTGGQLVAGIAAWSFLAVTVAGSVRNFWVGRAGAALVLLLGLTPQVIQWDDVLLSESLAISLLVVLVALLVRMVQRPNSRLAAALLAVVLLWAFTRQVHVLLLIALLPFALAFAAWRLERRLAAGLAAGLLVIVVWSGIATSRDDEIWRFNARTLIAIRILPNPDEAAYFTDRGLPVTEELRAVVQRFSGSALVWQRGPVSRWIDEEWRSTYARYLLTRPHRTLAKPLGDAPSLLSTAAPHGLPRPVLPSPVREAIYATSPGDLTFYLVVVALLSAAAFARRRPSPAELLPWLLVLACYVWLVLTWNTSAGGLERLFLPIGVATRIALVLAAVWAVDRLHASRVSSAP